jgi:ATPase family associated with various cellular activities (AAA)
MVHGHVAGKAARFDFGAPTTARNAGRVLRALQLRKAVLLEGSPGVGKTSLVAALAAASGMPPTSFRAHVKRAMSAGCGHARCHTRALPC